MSSSIAIPKRKSKQLERASELVGSESSSPSPSSYQPSTYGSFEASSPQQGSRVRRQSLMCMSCPSRLDSKPR